MGRLLLVRHGQASFGADDYDVLSETGHAQAERLGAWLADHGRQPDAVVHGSLARQRDTALSLARGAGWDVTTEVDARWDEFDHLGVPVAFGGAELDQVADMRTMDRRAFQQAFEAATARWTAGEQPTGDTGAVEVETFVGFVDRVRGALDAACERSGPGASVVVVSSGGPIAACASLLLGLDGPALATAWSRFNTVVVNSGVTSVVVGATGPRLLTFNEHLHLADDLLTYR